MCEERGGERETLLSFSFLTGSHWYAVVLGGGGNSKAKACETSWNFFKRAARELLLFQTRLIPWPDLKKKKFLFIFTNYLTLMVILCHWRSIPK